MATNNNSFIITDFLIKQLKIIHKDFLEMWEMPQKILSPRWFIIMTDFVWMTIQNPDTKKLRKAQNLKYVEQEPANDIPSASAVHCIKC